ncbi:putative E3 ubiquitin-protein ligase HERC3 isoform X2 [Histomonas meleagridis]|uniref:putative E3 ubiquitin-protein ligase HERC3 isoform X2 n=1 Tax=Histomonas meleagridis TaxID=135588 RepID=UPI00355A29C7|nr:putative E3 ubiquitin-protein ligase HERC3 isoform X2 [Histomonas meleagridis]
MLAEIPNAPKDIIMFSSGMCHNLFYTKSKIWYGCGSNECGELCESSGKDLKELTELKGLEGFEAKYFVCGSNYSAIITLDGSLYVMGETYSTEPTKLPINQKITFVSGGWNSLIAIPEGLGIYYCIDGDQNIQFACPTIKFIDCGVGMSHFVSLTNEGEVYTWGEGNACGQGDDFYSSLPTKVNLTEDVKISRVFASTYNTFLVDENNFIWVTGYNDDGMGGLGEIEKTSNFIKLKQFTHNKIVQICGGRYMNYVLTNKGELFSSGNGEDYKLLQEDDNNYNEFHACQLTKDKNVCYISSGSEHIIIGINMNDEMINDINDKKREIE